MSIVAACAAPESSGPPRWLVLQSDFGVRDGAVSEMKGVAAGVDPRLRIADLTHEIPAFDVWEAAWRLEQAAAYWPAGTVFVSVVDPGVGSARRSVVLETNSGHLFVTPDNGTLTRVADALGVRELREIDEGRHRLASSYASHTFHGRDVYALTGARLAAGRLRLAEVGPRLEDGIVRLEIAPARLEGGEIVGSVPVLDLRFGNVWTDVGAALLERAGLAPGVRVRARIARRGAPVWEGELPFVHTFADVPPGEALLYLNSMGNAALARNLASFAAQHGVGSGPDWEVRLARAAP